METLAACLRRIFPGRPDDLPYYPWPDENGAEADPYATPPMIPADVFAAAGYVLQFSGAYHHVIADVPGRAPRSSRQIKVDSDFIARARSISSAWRAFKPDSHFSDSDPSVFAKWISTEGRGLRWLHETWRALWDEAGSEKLFEFVPAG